GSDMATPSRRRHGTLLRRQPYRLHEPWVLATAAEVSVELARNVLRGRVRVRSKQADCRHDHPGRAIAALKSLDLEERVLHRMQRVAVGQALDGDHAATCHRTEACHTRFGRTSIDEHRAGPALALAAAELGAGERKVVAQHFEQTRVR